MNRNLWLVRWGALLLVAGLGCGREAFTPKKTLEVPEGGPPVLTKSERAEKGLSQRTGEVMQPLMRGGVARASFEQPVVEPSVLKPLELWTEQEAAAHALGRIGAAAVPELVKALESPDPVIREKAVGVLGRMGPDAEAAVPALVKLLEDPDEGVRKATARTLGQIGPAAKEAVPSLMQKLMQPGQ